MKKLYETALILFGTLGWWGFVYPDLCLTEETCEQEYEGAKDYEENLPVNGEMAKPARKIKEINDSFDPKRSLTGKDKEKQLYDERKRGAGNEFTGQEFFEAA